MDCKTDSECWGLSFLHSCINCAGTWYRLDKHLESLLTAKWYHSKLSGESTSAIDRICFLSEVQWLLLGES